MRLIETLGFGGETFESGPFWSAIARAARSGRARLTSHAGKSLELTLREALADGSKELTATHLLRGVLRDPGPIATALIETKLPLAELRTRAKGSAAA